MCVMRKKRNRHEIDFYGEHRILRWGDIRSADRGRHEVALVVTQPDKPRGRSKKLQYPPVKEAALAHNIEVFQPKRVREAESIEYLKKYQPDCIVVVAFGQILPKEILEMPKYCCVNVHASPCFRNTVEQHRSSGQSSMEKKSAA